MPNHIRNIIRFDCDRKTLRKILNEIKVDQSGEQLKSDKAIKCNSIDFNKLIKMPDELLIEESSSMQRGLKLYLTKISPHVDYYGDRSEKLDENMFDEIYVLAKIREGFCESSFIYDKESIKQLFDKEEESVLLEKGKAAFDNLIKYGHCTWYSWRIDNWNTKWNAYDFSKFQNNTIEFSTAWDPPIPVIKALSDKYHGLTINHFFTDESLGYNTGHITYKDGNISMFELCQDGSKRAIDLSLYIYHDTPMNSGIIQSFDNSTYLPFNEEYDLGYIDNKECIVSFEKLPLSKIPSGFNTYFISSNKICNFIPNRYAGVVLTKEPIKCDHDGFCYIKPSDIEKTDRVISIEQLYNVNNQEIIYDKEIEITPKMDK